MWVCLSAFDSFGRPLAGLIDSGTTVMDLIGTFWLHAPMAKVEIVGSWDEFTGEKVSKRKLE